MHALPRQTRGGGGDEREGGRTGQGAHSVSTSDPIAEERTAGCLKHMHVCVCEGR